MTDRKKRFSIWAWSMLYMVASWLFFVARDKNLQEGGEEVLRTVLFVTLCPPMIAYGAWPLKSRNVAVRVLLRAVIFLVQLPLTMAIAFLAAKALLRANG